MPKNRYALKKDNNHKLITSHLTKLGISWIDTHMVSSGFGDIVVGYNNLNYIFEIKRTGKDKETPDEVNFSNNWNGQVNTISTIVQILQIIEYK